MLTKRLFIVAGAMLLASQAVYAQAGAGQDPKQIVDWIYGEVVKSTKNPSYNFSLLGKKHRPRFSKSFLTQWDAAEKRAAKKEDPLIEADPVTNSQDPQVLKFATAVDSQTDTAAQVTATFTHVGNPGPTKVTYKFVKEGGAWKIDDFGGMRDTFKAYK